MHDWWLASGGQSFRQITFLPDPTVLYRQHGANVLGAQGLGLSYWMQRLRNLFG